MPVILAGTWHSTKTEGWPELLEKMGVPKDKWPAHLKLTHVITQSGNLVNMKTTNNVTHDLKLNTINVGNNHRELVVTKEVEQSTAWEGDTKMVMRALDGSGGVTYELVSGQELVVTVEYMSLTAKTYFSK